ncbi:hypothetical protein GQ42DRAFT_4912 [Ramicandelaber brevisporus]|nr:hypothetical protein GQ42DRAFT_4912 [Ramicandelaber brevisporus]
MPTAGLMQSNTLSLISALIRLFKQKKLLEDRKKEKFEMGQKSRLKSSSTAKVHVQDQLAPATKRAKNNAGSVSKRSDQVESETLEDQRPRPNNKDDDDDDISEDESDGNGEDAMDVDSNSDEASDDDGDDDDDDEFIASRSDEDELAESDSTPSGDDENESINDDDEVFGDGRASSRTAVRSALKVLTRSDRQQHQHSTNRELDPDRHKSLHDALLAPLPSSSSSSNDRSARLNRALDESSERRFRDLFAAQVTTALGDELNDLRNQTANFDHTKLETLMDYIETGSKLYSAKEKMVMLGI